jgi:Holliday junction resolvase RusA-like endonuclease
MEYVSRKEKLDAMHAELMRNTDAAFYHLEDLTDMLADEIDCQQGFDKIRRSYKDAVTEVGALILTLLRVTGQNHVTILYPTEMKEDGYREIPIIIDHNELYTYYAQRPSIWHDASDLEAGCSFFVPGEPGARPRQRNRIRWRKYGKPYSQSYTPFDHKVNGWKQCIYWHYKRQKATKIETGPVIVDIDFFFCRPKSKQGAGCPEQAYLHDVKPDRDNLDKAVLDALKNAGAFKDDCQVAGGRIMKYWVAKGGEPGAKITIRRAV